MQKQYRMRMLQEQFFQLWQLAPASSTYNSGFSAFISGDLDATALQLAARMVFQRQEVQSGTADMQSSAYGVECLAGLMRSCQHVGNQ